MQDNPRFEFAKATVPDEAMDGNGEEAESVYSVAARMSREIVRHIETACEGDGVTCLMMIRRALGMTLDEIGCLSGLSHIAVRKRLRKVVERHPEMLGYLSPVCLDDSAREELESNGIFRTNDGHKRKTLNAKRTRKETKGVYDE